MISSTFACKMCGSCCRNLRGRLDYTKYATMRLGLIYHLVAPSLKTIYLFEWEIECLKKIGKVREIQVEVKPDLVFYDEINQIPLIIGWNLEHDDCPFLTCENKCGIYEERPLICQAFPLFSSGLLEESDIKSYLGDCPNAINPFKDGQMARRREFVKTMYKLYGNTWIASARRDFAIKWLYDLIVSAEGQKTIRRAKLNKKVIKALLREKPIGLLTFLLSKGTIKEEEITEKIKGINSPINENDIYMLLQD